jgi:hypothetical protein
MRTAFPFPKEHAIRPASRHCITGMAWLVQAACSTGVPQSELRLHCHAIAAYNNSKPPARFAPTREPDQHITMPSSSSSCLWSTLLLVSLFVAAFHHLPTVRAKFNETDCMSCVGEIDETFKFNKTYCEVGDSGSGTYQCVDFDDSNLCSGHQHTIHTFDDWSCDHDLVEAVAAAAGLAFGLIVCFWCCGAVVVVAIVGGIVACVVCSVRGSSNRQQRYAVAPPPMVLPGTLRTSTDKTTMMTADAAVLPAQTGLAGGMDSPYYQPSNDNSNNYKA